MNLELIVTLFLISVVLIYLDNLFKRSDIDVFSDFPALMMTGFLIMMLLGVGIMASGIDVFSGEYTYSETVYQYGNNFTGYHWDYDYTPIPPNKQDDAFLFHTNDTIDTTRLYSATSIDLFGIDLSHVIGFLLAILGGGGFIFALFDLKGGRDND